MGVPYDGSAPVPPSKFPLAESLVADCPAALAKPHRTETLS